jgi:transposase InsO family protein
VADHQQEYPVNVLCRVLGVARSGYYAWGSRQPGPQAQRRTTLTEAIRAVHAKSQGRYGSPRVHQALRAQGHACCVNTVAKLMNQAQIRAKTARRFVARTTDSQHAQPVAPNRLRQDFAVATRPDQVWVADITYLATGEGWLYLAAVLDLCSRKVVGWCVADHLRTELVAVALQRALRQRRPAAGLVHHSDRGVQYASDAYQELLKTQDALPSMSRRGNCYDNGVMECFFGTLKTELTYHDNYATRKEAELALFEYLEGFYNTTRLHSSLGYQSPQQFEDRLLTTEIPQPCAY